MSSTVNRDYASKPHPGVLLKASLSIDAGIIDHRDHLDQGTLYVGRRADRARGRPRRRLVKGIEEEGACVASAAAAQRPIVQAKTQLAVRTHIKTPCQSSAKCDQHMLRPKGGCPRPLLNRLCRCSCGPQSRNATMPQLLHAFIRRLTVIMKAPPVGSCSSACMYLNVGPAPMRRQANQQGPDKAVKVP